MSRLQEAKDLLAATEGRTWASYSSASGDRRGWEVYPLRDLLAAMVAEVEQLQALLSLAKDLSDAVDDYDDEEDEVTCFALYAAIPEANAKFQREFYREVRGGR